MQGDGINTQREAGAEIAMDTQAELLGPRI